MNAKRRAASLLLGVILAGCGWTPSASPGAATPASTVTTTPAATSRPTPSPTSVATPTAPPAGWTYTFPKNESVRPHPVFASDGTAYIYAVSGIFALDTTGKVLPGWPAPPFEPTVLGPDGSVYATDCGEPGPPCGLHRLGSDGRELSGWPFEPGCEIAGFAVGGDGTAYVACNLGGKASVVAVDQAGQDRPGWPLETRRSRVWPWGPQLLADPDPSHDPTLFMLDQQDSILTALDPDGHALPGWPARITGTPTYHNLARDGTVVVLSSKGDPVTRTIFTMIGPDGQTLSGWPRSVTGEVVDPTLAPDGTLYYVAPPGKLYARDRAGNVKRGWPVAIPGVDHLHCDEKNHWSCLAVGPDGTAYLMGLSEDDSEMIVALGPDGRTLPGWPYVWRDRLEPLYRGNPPWVPSYTGYQHGRGLGLAADGTVYVAVGEPDGVAIVALDHTGRVKPGWPYRPPRRPPNPLDDTPFLPRVSSMSVGPGDRLYAFIVEGDDWITTLVVVPPDGRVAE